MISKATSRYIPMSPQKARLVIDLIRGKNVNEALMTLKFTNKSATREIDSDHRSPGIPAVDPDTSQGAQQKEGSHFAQEESADGQGRPRLVWRDGGDQRQDQSDVEERVADIRERLTRPEQGEGAIDPPARCDCCCHVCIPPV